VLEEFRKSISAILYERITSPLFGTFIVSWICWNWKIVYLTLFVSESKVESNKIEYIVRNYSDPWILVAYPLASTILLILVVPFISNGAYWISLKFDKWRHDKKNEIEKNRLLTVEQSAQILSETARVQEEFGRIISQKDGEIGVVKKSFEVISSEKTNLKMELDELKSASVSGLIGDLAKEKLRSVLEGEWVLDYRRPRDPMPNKERVVFRDVDGYHLNGTLTFHLTDILFNEKSKEIRWDKIWVKSGEKLSSETLRIVDMATIIGTDTIGNILVYTRVGST
jgi:hypothetical protein